MRRLTLVLYGVVALFFMPAISADHFYHTPAAPFVAFHPRGGSTSSVEVSVSTGTCEIPVFARDEGGPWVRMTPGSQPCIWVARFPIEAGHLVQFRALVPDHHAGGALTLFDSCFFTHPRGEERCGANEVFEGAAVPVAGNEWWVEAKAGGTKQLGGVQARVDGGPWKDLTKRSWGNWASSFNVPAGSVVQLRVTSAFGETLQNHECYQWPSREPVNPRSSFPLHAFPRPSGNEWWVQVGVCSNHPVGNVSARVDGGVWVPLDFRPWGDWASSFHAPRGSQVEFLACPFHPDPRCSRSAPVAWPPA